MVRNQSNPCGKCKVTCSSNSVLCSNCDFWYHAKCEKLSPKDMQVLISAKSGYLCYDCAGNDYIVAIKRISEVSVTLLIITTYYSPALKKWGLYWICPVCPSVIL